jgi:hypothetical protein
MARDSLSWDAINPNFSGSNKSMDTAGDNFSRAGTIFDKIADNISRDAERQQDMQLKEAQFNEQLRQFNLGHELNVAKHEEDVRFHKEDEAHKTRVENNRVAEWVKQFDYTTEQDKIKNALEEKKFALTKNLTQQQIRKYQLEIQALEKQYSDTEVSKAITTGIYANFKTDEGKKEWHEYINSLNLPAKTKQNIIDGVTSLRSRETTLTGLYNGAKQINHAITGLADLHNSPLTTDNTKLAAKLEDFEKTKTTRIATAQSNFNTTLGTVTEHKIQTQLMKALDKFKSNEEFDQGAIYEVLKNFTLDTGTFSTKNKFLEEVIDSDATSIKDTALYKLIANQSQIYLEQEKRTKTAIAKEEQAMLENYTNSSNPANSLLTSTSTTVSPEEAAKGITTARENVVNPTTQGTTSTQSTNEPKTKQTVTTDSTNSTIQDAYKKANNSKQSLSADKPKVDTSLNKTLEDLVKLQSKPLDDKRITLDKDDSRFNEAEIKILDENFAKTAPLQKELTKIENQLRDPSLDNETRFTLEEVKADLEMSLLAENFAFLAQTGINEAAYVGKSLKNIAASVVNKFIDLTTTDVDPKVVKKLINETEKRIQSNTQTPSTGTSEKIEQSLTTDRNKIKTNSVTKEQSNSLISFLDLLSKNKPPVKTDASDISKEENSRALEKPVQEDLTLEDVTIDNRNDYDSEDKVYTKNINSLSENNTEESNTIEAAKKGYERTTKALENKNLSAKERKNLEAEKTIFESILSTSDKKLQRNDPFDPSKVLSKKAITPEKPIQKEVEKEVKNILPDDITSDQAKALLLSLKAQSDDSLSATDKTQKNEFIKKLMEKISFKEENLTDLDSQEVKEAALTNVINQLKAQLQKTTSKEQIVKLTALIIQYENERNNFLFYNVTK